MPITYVDTVRDFSVHWVDPATGAFIDPTDPTFEIAHYDMYGNVVYDVGPEPMVRVEQGHYMQSVYLSPTVFISGERFFVWFRGVDPGSGDDLFLEETFTAAVDPATFVRGVAVSFIC